MSPTIRLPKSLLTTRINSKRYGNVLQCHGSNFKTGASAMAGDKKGDADGKLKCDSDDGGNKVELKAGTDDNQHIVAIEPEGKGSDFAIVWLRFRGKEGEI